MAVESQRIAVIVEREGLGDALLKLPMLRAIRRARPDAEIWWLASNQTAMADVLRPYTEQSVAHVLPDLHLSGPLRATIARMRQLPRFHTVFDTRTRVADVFVSRFALRPREFYACLPGFLLSTRRPPGMRERPHGIGARAMALASAAIGAAADGSGGLPVAQAESEAAARDLPVGPSYVGLAPGSREAKKNWPLERFVAVARAMASAGHVPVFIIGPFEQPWLPQLREAVPQALFPTIDPIGRALAVLSRMTAVLANDSGMGHMTAALGVPLVSLFGPTDAERWRPVGGPVHVIRAQEFGGTTMDAIPDGPVIAALRDVAEKAMSKDRRNASPD
ncbi:MAG: glycosyltransferase family 9 protein [Rhizobiaceae bacterium]